MKLLLFIIFICFCQFAQAQEKCEKAVSILKKSIQKRKKITNGYYEFTYSQKWHSGKDTISNKGSISFYKKAANLEGIKYTDKSNIKVCNQQGYFNLSLADSSYIFVDTSNWYGQSEALFLDYIKPEKSILQKGILKDTSYKISYVGKEIIDNKSCHRIEFKVADMEQMGQVFTNIKFYYLIDAKSYLPLQYETTITYTEKEQYTKLALSKTCFNQKNIPKDIEDFQPQLYFKEKNNIPFTQVRALEIGDTLPDFTFQNLPNYNINFADLKQDYILLDFWYIGCFPCVLALPFVDSLAKTYENKNLFVLGVNPYDTSASKMSEFKKKKNINYSNILIDIKTADAMRIVGYPTLAIIERKTRKVLYVQRGYSEEMKSLLIDFIEKNVVK